MVAWDLRDLPLLRAQRCQQEAGRRDGGAREDGTQNGDGTIKDGTWPVASETRGGRPYAGDEPKALEQGRGAGGRDEEGAQARSVAPAAQPEGVRHDGEDVNRASSGRAAAGAAPTSQTIGIGVSPGLADTVLFGAPSGSPSTANSGGDGVGGGAQSGRRVDEHSPRRGGGAQKGREVPAERLPPRSGIGRCGQPRRSRRAHGTMTPT